jgi:hypothetical protein
MGGFGFYGMFWVGIPFVLTMAAIFATFFVCSYRVAKAKRALSPHQ